MKERAASARIVSAVRFVLLSVSAPWQLKTQTRNWPKSWASETRTTGEYLSRAPFSLCTYLIVRMAMEEFVLNSGLCSEDSDSEAEDSNSELEECDEVDVDHRLDLI